MSKQKTAMSITKNFTKVWSTGANNLQTVFSFTDPEYYNCGECGWNCDLYIDYEHDAIITTGYRNTRGKKIPYNLINKYEALAKKALENHHTLADAKPILEKIKNDFFAELDAIA